VPRARLFTPTGRREWASSLLPRYQRRLREVNETVVATYLAGANTRRLRGALGPLLRAAPLSKSAVSRIVGTLKAELEAWRTRSLAELDVVGLDLDALALRVRSAGKVVSVPALGVVAVLTDGQKQLVALDLCAGGETRRVHLSPCAAFAHTHAQHRPLACQPAPTRTNGAHYNLQFPLGPVGRVWCPSHPPLPS
jgi:putative transposase